MYNKLVHATGKTMKLDMKVYDGERKCIVHTMVTGKLDYSHLCFMWYVTDMMGASTHFTVNQIYDIRDSIIWVEMSI